jgi:4-diphosphocytidyl-2C-methyl-D-erythritol kinase
LLHNDLEAPAGLLLPEIEERLTELKKNPIVEDAILSGSGPTLLAFVKNESNGLRLVNDVKKNKDKYFDASNVRLVSFPRRTEVIKRLPKV